MIKFKIVLLFLLCLLGAVACQNDSPRPMMSHPLENGIVVEVYSDSITKGGGERKEISDTELMKFHTQVARIYTITAGDRFNFLVYDHPELAVDQLSVMPDGMVSLPLIGPILIGGLTLDSAHQVVTKALEHYIIKPRVALIPLSSKGYAFTITGSVNKPGRYVIEGELRLVDAVALSSGFVQGKWEDMSVELADLTHSYISRNGELLPIDFVKAFAGDSIYNIPLRNGDYIHIASTANQPIYVLGEVMRSRSVNYSQNLTLLKAIALAGGFKQMGYADNIIVVRGGILHPTIFKVDHTKLVAGTGYDFPLNPDDIVFVPKSGFRKYNDIIEQILPTLEAINLLAGPFGNAAIYKGSSN